MFPTVREENITDESVIPDLIRLTALRVKCIHLLNPPQLL